MRRLIALAALSVALYVALFGFIVDRPLSVGLLRLEMAQKTARLAALPSPKLVILAGSNGPYSHSCVVFSAMLDMPCENAGIAVGIGLDELFARYAPYLRRGDVLYMPMELEQYTASRAAYRAGADGAILLRHDRRLLAGLAPGRVLGAVFCCSLGDLLQAAAEMPVAAIGLVRPAALLARQYNAMGDRIGTTLASADRQITSLPVGAAPDAQAIADGYGARLIGGFVAAMTARGVTVIGGLPTQFEDVALPDATLAAVRQVYTGHGGSFMALPNRSEYPRVDFYDGKDHLAQPCQFEHSMLVAAALGLPVRPPPAAMLAVAEDCAARQVRASGGRGREAPDPMNWASGWPLVEPCIDLSCASRPVVRAANPSPIPGVWGLPAPAAGGS